MPKLKNADRVHTLAEEWLDEDSLLLLRSWARDGMSYESIAERIGISTTTLFAWRKRFPEIEAALKQGKELVDYKVENALLKTALGYRTKESKVITLMRNGKVAEITRETIDKEVAPNVSAIKMWLNNRCNDKWKNNRDAFLDANAEEDASIEVKIVRAATKPRETVPVNSNEEIDEEWTDLINNEISVKKLNAEETEIRKKKLEQERLEVENNAPQNKNTSVEMEQEDLDYWPEDWEDEDEDN